MKITKTIIIKVTADIPDEVIRQHISEGNEELVGLSDHIHDQVYHPLRDTLLNEGLQLQELQVRD